MYYALFLVSFNYKKLYGHLCQTLRRFFFKIYCKILVLVTTSQNLCEVFEFFYYILQFLGVNFSSSCVCAKAVARFEKNFSSFEHYTHVIFYF